MAKTLPISAFIIAQNEADRIHIPIQSVKDWVDEIIVIDSGSTDNTVQIAQALGCRVLHNPWPGYGPQKRFAEDQCKNTWLLNIDADEEITPELREEIHALFPAPPESGYILRIRDLLPGEQTLSRFAHTNFVLRLYNRSKGRFSDSPVHDSVLITEGTTSILTAPVLHRSYRSWAHVIEKMNRYSSMQAENMQKKGLACPTLRLLLEIPFAFFKDYILRGYIFRGRRGFINAILYSYGRFLRIAKYLELRDRG